MLTIPISQTVTAAPGIPGHLEAPPQRVLEIAAMFGLGIDAQREIAILPPCEIPLPYPQRGIIFVTGPSGGGKSTILRLLAAKCRALGRRVLDLNDLPEPVDRPLIDLIDPDGSLESAASLLSLVGLGDAFVMLRRPRELSDGQRYRINLARLMALAEAKTDYDEQPSEAAGGPAVAENSHSEIGAAAAAGVSAGAIIVADEFGATLDRHTARAIARNIRRWISRGASFSHTFIGATTHDDLLDELQPDVLIVKGLGDQIEITSHLAAPGSGLAHTGRADQCENLHLELATLADYDQLAQFHYKSGRPSAVTDVFRIMHRAPSVVGRYFNRSQDESQVVGVLVRSLPSLSCRMRDVATNNRYGGLRQRDAATMLNREVRTISRVVIDPQWRGMGLAVRLARHALDHPEPGTIFTEALAAMGRVSPFFERAGMTRYDRPPLRGRVEHARLIDALESLDISPAMLGCEAIMTSKLDAVDAKRQSWLLSELRRWHRAAHRTTTVKLNAMSMRDLLNAARDELICQPVYYVFRHGCATHSRARRRASPPAERISIFNARMSAFSFPFSAFKPMPIIALNHLEPHPDNANRMTPALLTKLIAHIRQTGEYPPLIVRPFSTQDETQSDHYQILDGHHRAQALRELGYAEAKCDVWHVDDERAGILLLTLNRLHGEDDPQRRGALIEKLSLSMDIKSLAKLLPENGARIRKLIEASHPPPPLAAPPDVQRMPQPVTFFLIESQRRKLFDMLAAICRDRSEALVKLLELNLEETSARTPLLMRAPLPAADLARPASPSSGGWESPN